jgi:hypothetical protein
MVFSEEEFRQSLQEEQNLTTGEAADLVQQRTGFRPSTQTLRKWCEAHGIGKKVVGRWIVNRSKLLRLVDNGKRGK